MTKKKQDRLYLLDGMALAYRAYFSFISRPLVNSKGENTSAIYGFVNALLKILDDEKPDHVAVVFDNKEPTFRHKMYPAYKATREKMPEDMASQLDKLKEVVEAFNVPLLELPGYEADDIMGTLARKAEGEGIAVFLVTGDKDFMQLISPSVKMFRPGKQGNEWEILDQSVVKEKFGVTPDRVTDVLALTGDQSDNVPGVKGVGDKTAIPLVVRFGSLEAIYQHIEDIPQMGLRSKLTASRENAFLSKQLVTIHTEVPIGVDIHQLKAKPVNSARLCALFRELEFKSLLKRFSAGQVTPLPSEQPPADITSDLHVHRIADTLPALKDLAQELSAAPRFVFDTETTSVNALEAELVGLSFAIRPHEAWYVPVTPPGGSTEGGVTAEDVRRVLGPVFRDAAIEKIGQNLKYDIMVLAAHGIEVEGILFDTMVASYILRPDAQHGMDAMAVQHLHYRTISYDDLTGTGKERKKLRDIPIKRVAEYSCEDADITFRLYEHLAPLLVSRDEQRLCETVEFPLIQVLARMEMNGIAIDEKFLGDLGKELERTLQRLTSSIRELAGEEFNLNSTQQLSRILFERLGLPTVRKIKTGFSTDANALEALRHAHPIVEQLLEYRQIQKLKSTYVDALPALINRNTGRIHTSFNQTVASTGRLSSADPNLQNIPIRTTVGQEIRKAFVPRDRHHILLSADYSQIELRVMAHLSSDEGLRTAFLNREDIHTTTAASVFGVPARSVTKDMRRKAKEVNFGVMYGIGPFGLASRLEISQQEAKEIIRRYFERFPKVKQYVDDTLATARRLGFVSTLLGRRRYLPDIISKNFNVRSNAERQAINMPVQGTAADMIKVAMIRIHRDLISSHLEAQMLLQVHDELVFEVVKNAEEEAEKIIVRGMTEALPLSVPVEVDVGSGTNWLNAH